MGWSVCDILKYHRVETKPSLTRGPADPRSDQAPWKGPDQVNFLVRFSQVFLIRPDQNWPDLVKLDQA